MAGVVTLAVSSVEARARVRYGSSSSHSSAPSVSKSSVSSRMPDASKPHLTAPAGSSISVSMPSAPPDNRGMFRRFWDSLFGRKPEPAPAPMVGQAMPGAQPLAGAASPMASAGVPNAMGAAAGLAVGSQIGYRAVAGGQPLQPDQQVAAVAGGLSPGFGAAAGAALGSSMAASLESTSGKAESEARSRTDRQASTAPRAQQVERPKPTGYVLHLHNGGTVSVVDYEEKGDRVVVSTRVGSFGLHRMDIARIEPQYSNGR